MTLNPKKRKLNTTKLGFSSKKKIKKESIIK